MPPYKRQHYLPTAYLKYFSVDQNNCTRDALVWRFDGKSGRLVPVKSQGFADYFYSREKAEEIEMRFQNMEDHYCRCIDKIKSGKIPNEHECGKIALMMIDLHMRNAAHKNSTGKEGIDAYRIQSQVFMNEILLGRKDGQATKEDILKHFRNFWSIRILRNRPGHVFLTSDHPSVWMTLRKGCPTLDIVVMPITPYMMAIAYDRRVLDIIRDEIDAEDELTLNSCQRGNSNNCLYASRSLSSEQISMIKQHFMTEPPSVCEVKGFTWQMSMLTPQFKFSFVHFKPPLF